MSTPAPLAFRPTIHANGITTIYRATTGQHEAEIYQVAEAANARIEGSWFVFVKVSGAILSVRDRFHTMAECRAFVAELLAAVAGPTHSELVAAIDAIREAAKVAPVAEAPVQPEPADVAVVVIPCAAAKQDVPAVAAELYVSANFRLMLRAARKIAADQNGRVLILSAFHGLLELDAVVAPYDLKMGDAGSVSVDAVAVQLAAIAPTSITTLLPHTYGAKLDAAADLVGAPDLIDLFADAPGIGFQRGVASRVLAAA